jgi:hypothetical protein
MTRWNSCLRLSHPRSLLVHGDLLVKLVYLPPSSPHPLLVLAFGLDQFSDPHQFLTLKIYHLHQHIHLPLHDVFAIPAWLLLVVPLVTTEPSIVCCYMLILRDVSIFPLCTCHVCYILLSFYGLFELREQARLVAKKRGGDLS